MIRRSLTAGALLASSLLPLATHLPSVGANTWVATGTHALPLKNATALGALPASTPLHIAVALQVRNRAGLDQFIRSANTPGDLLYGDSLTTAQFNSSYAPTAAQVQAVESYLSSQGFTSIQAESNYLYVTATGTVAQASSAFNTPIVQYRQNGLTVYANTAAAQVPAALGGVVLSVLGLSNVGRMSTPIHRAGATPAVPNYLVSYNPQDFWKAYDTGGIPTGSATTVAIFAEGNVSGTVKDLRTEEAANHLSQVPVNVVTVGLPSPDTAGADEWDMDTQYSTGMAGSVKTLYLYTSTSLTDADTALTFNRFAAQNVAKAGSASYGECEYQAYLDGSMVAEDQSFAQAAAQGQTVFASSGDTGGFCPVVPDNGVPAGAPDVNYPASSPYVVSVGGTTLLTNADGSYNNEIAWAAGGGGPSIFEYQPYWQTGVAPPTASTCVEYVACVGKDLPDISMDADPNSGANVYVNGSPTGVGGTSLASPLALGVWARLETAHANHFGFASPWLYGANGTKGFHDIILGNTGPYPATPGWDYATGLGSIDIMALNKAIVRPPTPVTTSSLPKPACTLYSDGSGDAKPTGSTGNVDSLDVVAGGFKAAVGQVTAQIMLKSLNDGPGGTIALAGDGNVWYATFSSGGKTYWLGAQYPGSSVDPTNPTNLVQYSYGTVDKSPTGGTLYNNIGTATGSIDTVKGIITISVPLTALGSPASNAILSSPGASTFESVGTPAGGLLETADGAGPGTNYTLGTGC